MSTATLSTTGIPYAIDFDHATKGFRVTVDGQYIGHRSTFHDSEELAREHIYDLTVGGARSTATQLDGGSSDEDIAADSAETRATAARLVD